MEGISYRLVGCSCKGLLVKDGPGNRDVLGWGACGIVGSVMSVFVLSLLCEFGDVLLAIGPLCILAIVLAGVGGPGCRVWCALV
eukprot:scaffold17233_cov87-Cylindrotheca_fusiformis.AAC.5